MQKYYDVNLNPIDENGNRIDDNRHPITKLAGGDKSTLNDAVEGVLNFARGLSHGAAKPFRSIAYLASKLPDLTLGTDYASKVSDGNIAAQKEYENATKGSIPAAVGEFAGDALGLAVPGGAVSKAASKVASAAPKTSKAIAMANNVFLNPAQEYSRNKLVKYGIQAPLAGMGAQTTMNYNNDKYDLGESLIGAPFGILGTAIAGRMPKTTGIYDELREKARAYMDKGYKITPSEIGKSSFIEMIGGKKNSAELAGEMNNPLINSIIKNDFGVLPNERLSVEKLKTLRKTHGEAYEDIKKINRSILSDEAFNKDRAHAVAKYNELTKQFTSFKNKDIEKIFIDMSQKGYSPGAITEAIKGYRSRANANWRSPEPAKKGTGLFEDYAHKSLEDLLERNLKDMPGLVGNLKTARKNIAKTYSAQKALDGEGNINALKLADQLESGVPLTDGMLSAAQFATDFPKMVKSKSANNDDALSTIKNLSNQIRNSSKYGILAQGLALGQLPLNHLLMSNPYQKMFVKPTVNTKSKLYKIPSGLLDATFNHGRLGGHFGLDEEDGLILK